MTTLFRPTQFILTYFMLAWFMFAHFIKMDLGALTYVGFPDIFLTFYSFELSFTKYYTLPVLTIICPAQITLVHSFIVVTASFDEYCIGFSGLHFFQALIGFYWITLLLAS